VVRHAHNSLGFMYDEGGDLKKAKFHYEVAAMAGHELARYNIAAMEDNSGNMGRAIKHLSIAASAGCFDAMHGLTTYFKKGLVSRFEIDSILTAYNNSCAEMRSKDRDDYIHTITGTR